MTNRKLNIDGEVFMVVRPRSTSIKVTQARKDLFNHSYKSLKEAYSEPSKYKENIYYYWLDWSLRNTVYPLYITSRNVFQFTLAMIYKDENGNYYLLRVTKAKQTAILLEND